MEASIYEFNSPSTGHKMNKIIKLGDKQTLVDNNKKNHP